MNPNLVASHVLPVPSVNNGSPLLERLRQAACARGDSQPTADNLVAWGRVFILFHNKRHPSELGLAEVTHFLEHVVQTASDPLPARRPTNWPVDPHLSTSVGGANWVARTFSKIP